MADEIYVPGSTHSAGERDGDVGEEVE